MDPRQLDHFRQITLDYFAKLAPTDSPALRDPYLHFGDPELLEYTSLVEIHGRYRGCLCLTSSRPTLEELLRINGERESSERTLLDMCRELSNVLSGNASHAFGGEWEISVPRSLEPGKVPPDLPPSAFVMPFDWRGDRSFLIIGLEPNGG